VRKQDVKPPAQAGLLVKRENPGQGTIVSNIRDFYFADPV